MKSGIPTTYRGTRCRSRLEAKWLCFFDLLGLPWAYEPFDLRGYVPDVLVGDRLLCEIRPLSQFVYDDTPIVEAREQIAGAASQTGHTPVVLGVDWTVREWAVGNDWTPLELKWRLAVERGDLVAHFGDVVGSMPLRHQRIGGDFNRLWRESGSRVQWKRSQKQARVIRRPEGL